MSIAGLGPYGSTNCLNTTETKRNGLVKEKESFKEMIVQKGNEQNGMDEEAQVTPLGIGFANAGSMGYGMSASLVAKPGCDDTSIQVKIATGSGNEFVDVNLSNFDPKNATAVEMFAYCQYMDATGEGVNNKWGSWNALKYVTSPSDGMNFGTLDDILHKKINWTGVLAKSETILEKGKTGETLSAADLLKMFKEAHKITAQELKDGKNWRDLSDEEWDKMLQEIDQYIDDFKERLKQMKEMQEEAAQKASMEASPDRRTIAASSAALKAAADGYLSGTLSDSEAVEGGLATDERAAYKKNWTQNLNTEGQTILRTAQMAQDMEKMALSKYQEIMLTDETTVGVGRTEGGMECATVGEDENKEKVWTITAFTEHGIVSNKCQNGKIISHWEMKYQASSDAKRVQDYLEQLDKEEDMQFAGSQEFWERFLAVGF